MEAQLLGAVSTLATVGFLGQRESHSAGQWEGPDRGRLLQLACGNDLVTWHGKVRVIVDVMVLNFLYGTIQNTSVL